MLSKDIDLNFGINPLTGDLNLKKGNAAVNQALKTLLLLGLYEKPFNSDLGPNLRGYLFENYIFNSNKYLEDRIKQIILRYEPRVRIKRIEVKSNEDNNAIDIQIEYYYSGETTESISLSVERTR
jgi:hypothetical protein